MGTDNLITAEDLAKQVKMAAEGIKKKPGLMKSTAASMAPGGSAGEDSR